MPQQPALGWGAGGLRVPGSRPSGRLPGASGEQRRPSQCPLCCIQQGTRCPCVPWDDPGALGVAGSRPPPHRIPAGLRGAGPRSEPAALTAPSAAACLCPDSVLVAEDGAVQFRPAPADGGSAGAGSPVAVSPHQPPSARGSSAGFGVFSLVGASNSFFLAPEVAEQKPVTEKVPDPRPFQWPPPRPPHRTHPPLGDATPSVQRASGSEGSWWPQCGTCAHTPRLGLAWAAPLAGRCRPGPAWPGRLIPRGDLWGDSSGQ